MPTESLVFSVSIDQQNQVLPILLGITNVQYPKAKEPMWWTVHPNSFSLISEDWDDRLFQLAERDEKNYGETGVLGKSQGTQKYKGRSRGHLHLRGPSCVFLIFYPTEKKKKKQIVLFSLSEKEKRLSLSTLRECLQKGVSARNRVKIVVPAVLSWETKLKKPQRKRNCSMTNKKSKSCVSMAWCIYVSPADLTWTNVWLFMSSGGQSIADRCVHLWGILPSLGKPFQTNIC